MEISIAFIVSAFIAGVLMFLAPCTLPLVPAYLAFISGVKQKDALVDQLAHAKVIKNAIAFVFGFSLIFIAFGMLAGFFGSFVGQFRGLLTQIGGVFIIIFGLMMLHVISFAPLTKEIKMSVPAILTPGKPSSAAFMGATFALGWTPCVGPILASILLLATTGSTVVTGGLLLAVFSLGLSMPFLLTAVLYTRASSFIEKYSWATKSIDIVGGLLLIAIGILLLTDNFSMLVEYGYQFFSLLGFGGLFELY